MTNQELKDQLGNYTKSFENQVKEISPFYTNLEPYQRGMLILALLFCWLLVIYWLTKPNPTLLQQELNKKLAKKEKELEERILRQMAFYKRLKEE